MMRSPLGGVCLNALRVNTDAYRLYQRLGFVVVAETDIRRQMRAYPPVAESGSATMQAATTATGTAVRLWAATPSDQAFVVDMARHACVIEDWPLPDPADDEVRRRCCLHRKRWLIIAEGPAWITCWSGADVLQQSAAAHRR